MAHNQCITTGPVGAAGTTYVDVGYAAGNCIEAAVTGKLVYGSGGTSIRVRLEGSYDAGKTWMPVGDMLFGTASAEKTFIVQSDSTDVFNPGDPLSDNTVRKALPPRLRVSTVVTGTYAGSTLDVWIGLKENAAFKVGQLDTDPTMAANSDARVPSQKAVAGYVGYVKMAFADDPDPAAILSTVPSITSLSWRALAVDPSYPTRLWGNAGTTFSYRDLSGSAGSETVCTTPCTSGYYIASLLFTATKMFAVTAGITSRMGQIWRSPLPDASASNIVWEKLFDLNGGILMNPGPAYYDGGENSYFREGSVVIDAASDRIFALEYGTTVTGGPSFYHANGASTTNAVSMLWGKAKTWTSGRHGHALMIDATTSSIWATIGDAGFSDLGLYRAPLADVAAWVKVSSPSTYPGGNDFYGVNMRLFSRAGVPMILLESDLKIGYGLLLHQRTDNQPAPLLPVANLPAPYFGTGRALHIRANGHIYFHTTGEKGAAGAFDAFWVWRFGDPSPVRIYTTPATPGVSTVLTTVETASHLFIGAFRLTKAVYRDE